MKSMPVIPSSPAQRWLRFRTQGLQAIGFLFLMTVVLMMWRSIVPPVVMQPGRADGARMADGNLRPSQVAPVEGTQTQGHGVVRGLTPMQAQLEEAAVLPRERMSALK